MVGLSDMGNDYENMLYSLENDKESTLDFIKKQSDINIAAFNSCDKIFAFLVSSCLSKVGALFI